MKIQQILSQHRRDFTATLVCENCNNIQKLSSGYDDDFYHNNVIPAIKCDACGECSPEDYRPLSTKYEDWETV